MQGGVTIDGSSSPQPGRTQLWLATMRSSLAFSARSCSTSLWSSAFRAAVESSCSRIEAAFSLVFSAALGGGDLVALASPQQTLHLSAVKACCINGLEKQKKKKKTTIRRFAKISGKRNKGKEPLVKEFDLALRKTNTNTRLFYS